MRAISEESLRNRLKVRLSKSQLSLCFSVKHSRTGSIARMAHGCGYDALYIDLQHSTISMDMTSDICTAAQDVGITPLVRVARGAWSMMSAALDGGAMGVLVSDVNTPAEAEEIAASVRYAPLGRRSFMSGVPQLRYQSWPADKANAFLNAETLICAIVETREGIENVDEIFAVDGIDMVMIGANDLCADYGIAGQLDHPLLHNAYRRVITAGHRHGKFVGVGGLTSKPDLIARYVEAGARFVSAGTDQAFMLAAASERADLLRRLQPDS